MNLKLLLHMGLACVLLIAFCYGASRSFKKDGELFLQVVTCSTGTMFLGELFFLVELICFGDIVGDFQVGFLGTWGSYFFLLSASYGQQEKLWVKENPEIQKIDIAAGIAPVAILVIYAVNCMSDISRITKVLDFLLMVPLAVAAFHGVRSLIILDHTQENVQMMRKYNIVTLCIYLLSVLRVVFDNYHLEYGVYIVMVLLAIVYGLLLPVAEKVVKQWSI